MRMTLISDTTQEFPDNTNVDFKVRLAEPIHLKGEERWQAALVSMSTQNRPIGSIGIETVGHIVRLRNPRPHQQVLHVGPPSHFGHSGSPRDGGRSV